MLPPVLFYGLATALLFFGVLRVTYLGVFADRTKPAKRDSETGDNADSDGASADDIDGESRQERYQLPPKLGFGLINMMGLGRMSPAKRHTVMGGLWIVLGLYLAWSGYSMGRKQMADAAAAAEEEMQPSAPIRMIRAQVAPAAPAELKAPAPAELKAPAEAK
jgi:hypothetical protein